MKCRGSKHCRLIMALATDEGDRVQDLTCLQRRHTIPLAHRRAGKLSGWIRKADTAVLCLFSGNSLSCPFIDLLFGALSNNAFVIQAHIR